MAINPPGDILLDVVNAADPSRLEVAQARLKAGQAAQEAQRIASTDKAFNATLSATDRSEKLDPTSSKNKDVPESYRKFESMVLSNFLKTMMPDSEEIYGKGATGEIWKGMMAEQLASEIARKGGIGIAESLTEKGSTAVRSREAADNNRGSRLHMASQLVEENQMKILDKLVLGQDRPESHKV